MHPIRQAVITPDDRQRSLAAIRDALCYSYNDDAFDRVIYGESHDEVTDGKARVPQEIDPEVGTPKRSSLAAALVFPAPVIPMLFRGRNSWKQSGFGTRSPWAGISATSSAASSGSTAT